MNWTKAAEYLENFSERAQKNVLAFEERYGMDGGTEARDQVQRKRIYSEIAYMLAGAIRAALDASREKSHDK